LHQLSCFIEYLSILHVSFCHDDPRFFLVEILPTLGLAVMRRVESVWITEDLLILRNSLVKLVTGNFFNVDWYRTSFYE
jgi:hypothetical protein